VLIDERAARAVCRELRIAVRGTLGVLVAAKALGHLVSVRPILDLLRATGFWLDDGTRRAVLEIAGETE
jgi:predicted nucleic acid-binding protein